jgi:hypothetical protein
MGKRRFARITVT